MEEFEIEYEINEAINYFQKGQTLIQIRRNIIEKGVANEFASKISKEAYLRFLHKNAKMKIIWGSIWFICGISTAIFLFQFGYIVVIFGSVWGLFQILSGISNIRSANKMANEHL